ncbi:MAG TPA: NFACT family protein [Candidatus Obscuribacterales bacterium]
MQPFDALTIRAVLDEAKPLLVNRKVDKVFQIARDEILLTLRTKAGHSNLLLSAQASYGRLCLVKSAPSSQSERSPQNHSPFVVLLRKNLTGAVLVHVEQLVGERIVDFVFSCTDEVGTASHKVLTAEIMGRHSNLIFWDKNSGKIVTASHIVTKDMSRQREIAPNLTYKRPPGQEKPNLFQTNKEEFAALWAAFVKRVEHGGNAELKPDSESSLAQQDETTGAIGVAIQTLSIAAPPFATVEQWLINSYTGLGRHLAEELVLAAGVESAAPKAAKNEHAKDALWQRIEAIINVSTFKPALNLDLSRYTVLSWYPSMGSESQQWKSFPAVNDLIDEYYRAVETREHFNQQREKLRNDLKLEAEKLTSRLNVAAQHIGTAGEAGALKQHGDLILAHQTDISAGQSELVCDNLFSGNGEKITIKLNPNLNAIQNAQWCYRQFSKLRNRQSAAQLAHREASNRLSIVEKQMSQLEDAQTAEELRRLKEAITGRKPQEAVKAQQPAKKKNKSRLLSLQSSDGWTIYVGRNRQENDHLLNRLAQPQDIWLHILGQGGAHVLVKVPGSKQEPPLNTLKEAAQVAARLSKATSGAKVRVVYTQCKYVKKIGKDKPGMVRYENEKTLEIDTSLPMPKCMKQLFST